MADADLQGAAVAGRSIGLTDSMFGATLSEDDAATAFSSDTLVELIARIFANPPATLTDVQTAALRALLQLVAEPAAAATANLLKLQVGATVYNVDEVVDVTRVGLPILTEANHRSVFIDFDTPRAWIGHREVDHATDAQGAWSGYANANYLGAQQSQPSIVTPGQYYYDTNAHEWRLFRVIGGTGRFRQTTVAATLGAPAVWLGEQADDQTAVNMITAYQATSVYYFFDLATGTVRVLDGTTYVAPVGEQIYYTAEPISAPGGTATAITGVSAGAGLGGGGTSGVVTIRDNRFFPIPTSGIGGTRNAYTLTTGHNLAALEDGMLFLFSTDHGANTSSITIDVDGLGAMPFQRSDGSGDLADFLRDEVPDTSAITALWLSSYSAFSMITPIEGLAAKRNVGTAEGDLVALDAAGAIPVAQGGTGATTAVDARTNLGITMGGGFTLRYGAGAPAAALGADGDWYTNTITSGFYEKVAGAWLLRYTIVATSSLPVHVYLASAAFTQAATNIIAFTVTPTTTAAPNVGDLLIIRTPSTIATTTGIGLFMNITGIGGAPLLVLDRPDGADLNADQFAVDSAYMAVYDGTNFELIGTPTSPDVATRAYADGVRRKALFPVSPASFATGSVRLTVHVTSDPEDGDVIVFGVPSNINDSTSDLLLRTTVDGSLFSGSHDLFDGVGANVRPVDLTAGDTVSVYRIGTTWYLTHLPRNLARTGGATFTGAVAFNGAVTGQTPTADSQLATKGYVDGLVGVTPPSHTSYCTVSTDDVFDEPEFLAGTTGTGNALAAPVYTGRRYVAFARPTSAGAITAVFVYAQGAGRGNSQFGSWTVESAELSIGGEQHFVVRSNNDLAAVPVSVTLIVEVE